MAVPKDVLEIQAFRKKYEKQREQGRKEAEAKLEEILTQHLFIPTEKEIKQIIDDTMKYPNYNTQELKELLFRMAMATKPAIADAEYEDDKWKIHLEIWFVTTPTQLKKYARDWIQDYPTLFLTFNIGRKMKNVTPCILSQEIITLGQAVSLLKQFNFTWL